MNKLTMLLVAAIFASPVFAEEAKVEAPKQVEAAATDEAKKAPEAAAEEAKAPEAVTEEAKKEEPAAAPEVKKEVKAKPAKKAKHGMKKHKTTTYTVVPPKKYKVVPVK